jgi:hypothetical protein
MPSAVFVLPPGQAGTVRSSAPCWSVSRSRLPIGRPGAVAADKAYSSRSNRAYLR